MTEFTLSRLVSCTVVVAVTVCVLVLLFVPLFFAAKMARSFLLQKK